MSVLQRQRSIRVPRAAEIAAGAAGVSLWFAGTFHVLIAPMHFEHGWQHGTALVTVGMLDLAWTAAWIRGRSRFLVLAGWFLTTLTLTLYAISRVLPLPFEGRPEEIGALNLGTQLFELGGLVALAGVSVLTRGRTARPLVIVCSLAFAAAWLVFGAATLAAAATH